MAEVRNIKEIERAVSMANEESLLRIVRRLEEKVDQLQATLDQQEARRNHKPRSDEDLSRNRHGAIRAAVARVFEEVSLPLHITTIKQIIDEKFPLPVEFKVSAVNHQCNNLVEEGTLELVSRGVYRKVVSNG